MVVNEPLPFCIKIYIFLPVRNGYLRFFRAD